MTNCPGALSDREHERKLHVGEVLHFVDRDEVVDGLHLRQPGLATRFGSYRSSETSQARSVRRGSKRTARCSASNIDWRTPRPRYASRESSPRARREHAAQLLERLVGVCEPDLLPVGSKKATKSRNVTGRPYGQSHGLEERPIVEEVGLLIFWGAVEGDVEARARSRRATSIR